MRSNRVKHTITQKEYHQILFELGILDDEEDWELYKQQEAKFNQILDTHEHLYTRCMGTNRSQF